MNTCTRFEVRPIDKATARDIIVANHYSHNWAHTFGAYSFGVFDDLGLAGVLANELRPGLQHEKRIRLLRPSSRRLERRQDGREAPSPEGAARSRAMW